MHKGKLTIWKDDRGFGFIQLDDTEKKVFLHISSLRNKRKRPQEGDIIKYQLTTDEKGKLTAINASIQEKFLGWMIGLLVWLLRLFYGD
jgi:cold shock CspA family protein